MRCKLPQRGLQASPGEPGVKEADEGQRVEAAVVGLVAADASAGASTRTVTKYQCEWSCGRRGGEKLGRCDETSRCCNRARCERLGASPASFTWLRRSEERETDALYGAPVVVSGGRGAHVAAGSRSLPSRTASLESGQT